ncbi:MAG: hypothetical protein KDB98_14065, partial [Flavobacteriales bacterium]|nr:hypothetical protein [Flavobacteriales bacterium]
SDYFHLLIDRKIKQFGLAGNISRVHLELDPNSDFSKISELLSQNPSFRKAAGIQYKLNWPFTPKWIEAENREPRIIISDSLTENAFKTQILNRKVDNDKGLVCIDLCSLENGTKHAVISMHHALFDHQGMMNFIQALNGNFDGDDFAQSTSTGFWKSLMNFIGMTIYMLSRGSSKLGSLLSTSKSNHGIPRYDSIRLSAEESKAIEKNAWTAGSRIGTSAYLISCVARSVNSTLQNRGENAPYLWFSTPHKQRKLGTKGHLFSNQLSFLFFKLTNTELNSNATSVEAMNLQLRAQIKEQITEKYAGLMDALRYVPLFIYDQMVNLSAKGKLASFGFSDLGTDQLEMDSFCGQKVIRVFRYPPVPTPPGFNVAVVRSNEQFEFVFGYVEEAISEYEMEQFKIEFKKHLLNND